MSSRNWRVLVVVAALPTLVAGSGCRTTGTRPDDMSATAHEMAAQEHTKESKSHAAQYDPGARRAAVAGGVSARSASRLDAGDLERNPTDHHKDAASHQARLAEEHRAAAQVLESFEAEQCVAIAPNDRASCPLLGTVTSTEHIDGGVRLRLLSGTDTGELLARARCHFAFGRTAGREGMPGCPLYLRDADVRQLDEETIELTTPHAEDVDALRHRTAAHVAN